MSSRPPPPPPEEDDSSPFFPVRRIFLQRHGLHGSSSSSTATAMIMEPSRVQCPQCQVSHGYQPAESYRIVGGDISTRYSHNARVLHQEATCPVCLDTVAPPIVVLSCGHTICPEHFQRLHGKIGQDAMLSYQETLQRERDQLLEPGDYMSTSSDDDSDDGSDIEVIAEQQGTVPSGVLLGDFRMSPQRGDGGGNADASIVPNDDDDAIGHRRFEQEQQQDNIE